jgi:membrane protein DedA with SNARE-associated domain
MDPLSLGLAVVVGLLLVKEAGVPVPVPGDLLVIGLGVGAAQGRFDPLLAIVAVIVASIIGGSVQFVLVRGPGRRVLVGLLRRLGVPESRIERQTERLRRGGAGAVAIARMTPGIRIVAIAAAGLAAMPFARFVVGLSSGNAIFAGGHFVLGLAFGSAATSIASGLLLPLVVLLGLVVVGFVGWRLIAGRRGRGHREGPAIAGETADWTDACCPACLLLGAGVTR